MREGQNKGTKEKEKNNGPKVNVSKADEESATEFGVETRQNRRYKRTSDQQVQMV